jgi:hypothetical protein
MDFCSLNLFWINEENIRQINFSCSYIKYDSYFMKLELARYIFYIKAFWLPIKYYDL